MYEPAPIPPYNPPPRSTGPSGAALLLIGVIVGGIAGGATATLLDGRTPAELVPTPVPSAIGSSAPVTVPAGADQIVDVAREMLPSVVTVVNRTSSGQQQSSGSGFVIDARGYVVTNNHVVENARGTGAGASFDVIFSDNRTQSATLVGRDPETDIAVLQIPGSSGLKIAPLANSDEVPVGAAVVAIGSPLGEFQNTVTTGVVSGKGRRLQVSQNVFLDDLVQTDAAINPGNSGGPLIWAVARRVIGMNTLIADPQQAQGLGFAVSANTIRIVADELIKNGRVDRGYIGIQYAPLSPRAAVALGLPPAAGIQISAVVPGSPASGAGLRVNDVITKLNDQQIDQQHALQSLLLRFRPGERVRLTIIRGSETTTIELTLGARPS
ncbi:MAG TPA: trypsin-like peptidase domain-containing protein [Candidatus Limnocylindria bacterium]|nr:trypsin-like peptidase domain-containing protein [Candidatus Limnocylindria bacterium]